MPVGVKFCFPLAAVSPYFAPMIHLVIVSLVWAFSFGLIGNQLAGLPPAWLAWIRLAISAAVFLPFVRRMPAKSALALFAIGAVQFGFMYLAYMTSFRYLQSHEVALFTVVTPLFVAGLDDLFGRKFKPWNLVAALLAVCGAGLIKWQSMESAAPLKGILLVQISNVCFAAGQLAYRAVMARLDKPLSDHRVFFWLHFGGFAVLTPLALPIALAATPPAPTFHQVGRPRLSRRRRVGRLLFPVEPRRALRLRRPARRDEQPQDPPRRRRFALDLPRNRRLAHPPRRLDPLGGRVPPRPPDETSLISPSIRKQFRPYPIALESIADSLIPSEN
jgi:hypothetical protein